MTDFQGGDPGSLPARSACQRKVEIYHCVIDLLPPVTTTGLSKAVPCVTMSVTMHIKDPELSALYIGRCNHVACFCLSLYSLYMLDRDDNMIQTNTQKNNQSINGQLTGSDHMLYH